jgi:hypothetical protein
LIEDYWEREWGKVEEDFREMRDLGANVVRVHLQFGKFMTGPDRPNADALTQLRRLLQLAERHGLYLDITGLGCYHKADTPAWYDKLPEQQRWDAQARFWDAVAKTCAPSPALFCYDLMNEPIAPAGPKKEDWLGPPFAGKHFVQWIALDLAGRDRAELARRWIDRLAGAIRPHDRRGMITVGLVPWSLDRPGLSSGFVPAKVHHRLDFVSVHLYPERGKLDEAVATLKGFDVGKPVLIEETFPLHCGREEFAAFLGRSRPLAAGWIGFYWGKSPAELRRSREIADAIMLGFLDEFQAQAGPRR